MRLNYRVQTDSHSGVSVWFSNEEDFLLNFKTVARNARGVTRSARRNSDIGLLFRPQGAGADILTKYVLRSVKDDLGEERCR